MGIHESFTSEPVVDLDKECNLILIIGITWFIILNICNNMYERWFLLFILDILETVVGEFYSNLKMLLYLFLGASWKAKVSSRTQLCWPKIQSSTSCELVTSYYMHIKDEGDEGFSLNIYVIHHSCVYTYMYAPMIMYLLNFKCEMLF